MRTIILAEVIDLTLTYGTDRYGTVGKEYACKCYFNGDEIAPVYYLVYLFGKEYRFEQADYVTDVYCCEELDNSLLFERYGAVEIDIPISTYEYISV